MVLNQGNLGAEIAANYVAIVTQPERNMKHELYVLCAMPTFPDMFLSHLCVCVCV
jgi:hypothetical protein